MVQKVVNLPDIGEVILAKRKGTRSLRLSVAADGKVRVGMPHWAPYQTGIEFALKRRAWIKEHTAATSAPAFDHGIRIGKSYRLNLVEVPVTGGLRTRVSKNEITISGHIDLAKPGIHQAIQKACERALKKDAQRLLPIRLEELASKNGFKFNSVRIKRLRSRWGSCSHKQDIVLNYYLVQLPWDLIDYVILHELVHTEHLNHSRDFWNRMDGLVPDLKKTRKEMKSHKPAITI
jgi:predicted metal-dependent hydrolase